MPIRKSVGWGGVNDRKDVLYVQSALNLWLGEHGRPPIKVNGTPSRELNAAIEVFQRCNRLDVEGRISPNSLSIKLLDGPYASYQRQLKAFSMLAVVLSFNPERVLGMDNQTMYSMLRSVACGKRG